MRTAILSYPNEDLRLLQELISAARIFPAAHVCVFVFEEPSQDLLHLAVEEIVVLSHASCIADVFTQDLSRLIKERNIEILLSSSSLKGNELITKLALNLGMSVAKWVSQIELHETKWILNRPVYGFMLEAEFSMRPGLLAMTMVSGAFQPDERSGNPKRSDIKLNREPIRWVMDFYETPDDIATHLDDYDTVVIVGRGIGSRHNVERIQKICLEQHWGLGCTRPVAMSGWLPMSTLVGLSGALIHPKRIVVLGASGAMPFLEGIKNSGQIIAINTDKEAAIFRICDIGIIEECEKAILKLENLPAK